MLRPDGSVTFRPATLSQCHARVLQPDPALWCATESWFLPKSLRIHASRCPRQVQKLVWDHWPRFAARVTTPIQAPGLALRCLAVHPDSSAFSSNGEN